MTFVHLAAAFSLILTFSSVLTASLSPSDFVVCATCFAASSTLVCLSLNLLFELWPILSSMSFCTRFVLHNSLASTLSIASFSSFDDDYVARHLHVSKKNTSDNWSHVSLTSLCMLTLSDVLLAR